MTDLRSAFGTVLETKLIPPVAPGRLVCRGHLVGKVIEGAAGRLVLIDAPAGYGKSSVLTQAHKAMIEDGRRTAWLSLDVADNDHGRFVHHLLASIRRSGLATGANTERLLRTGVPLPAHIVRTSLLNEIVAIQDDLVLFLDDYHLIANGEVRETVVAILSSPLNRLHLVVSSRGRNEIPVGKLRAAGQLTEIGIDEMAFSDVEAQAFFERACRYPVDPQQVARLRARTEGWAASLQLACIALPELGDVSSFLDSFSGTTRGVAELLSEEVMQRQPPALQAFLMATSILGRFDVGLANEVCGRSDARQAIAEIEAKNLFIFSLDDRGTWYRYHHLFAEFLKRRLIDHHPDQFPVLQRRAAHWFARYHCFAEAFGHAIHVDDPEFLGSLLEPAAAELYAKGEISTLHTYSAYLPASVQRRLPRLQLELTWDQEIEWRFSEARQTLGDVRRALANESAAEPGIAVNERAGLISKLAHREMMLDLLEDRLGAAKARCEEWQRKTPSLDAFMRASVGTAIMVANREQFRCDGVPADAAAQRRLFLEGGAIYGTVFHDSATAATLFARGELSEAEHLFEDARRCAIQLHGEKARLTAMPTAMLAELCYEKDQLIRARDLLAQHEAATAEFGWLEQSIARFVTASRLAWGDQRPADADAALETGLAIARRFDRPRLTAHMLCERIRQAVAAGQLKAAESLLRSWDRRTAIDALAPGASPTIIDELLALSWARVRILAGNPLQPLTVLKRWIGFAKERRCYRALVRISSVLALAQAQAGDDGAARRAIVDAMEILPQQGFVRSFVDESPIVAAIFASVGDEGGIGRAAPTASSRSAPVEPLSPREIDILRRSAQGMATIDVARSTHLSASTVKWYWNRIYAKLRVHRRFDAIRIARQNGWLV